MAIRPFPVRDPSIINRETNSETTARYRKGQQERTRREKPSRYSRATRHSSRFSAGTTFLSQPLHPFFLLHLPLYPLLRLLRSLSYRARFYFLSPRPQNPGLFMREYRTYDL